MTNKYDKKFPLLNIKKIAKYIKFVTIAEGGAMGVPGAIELFCRVNGQNILYEGNRFYGEKIIDYKKLKHDFPKLNYMKCFFIQNNYSFKGWKYVSLGCGNNLYVSKDVYDHFKLIIDHMPGYQIYASLYEYIFVTLLLLERGFINKKKFLSQYKENNVSEKELKYISIDINSKINTDKECKYYLGK